MALRLAVWRVLAVYVTFGPAGVGKALDGEVCLRFGQFVRQGTDCISIVRG